MTSPLVHAWRVSNDLNHLFLEGIPEEWLADQYSERTRTVASQFAHIHNVRVSHLERRGSQFAGGLEGFPRGAQPTRDELLAALDASEDAMAELLDWIDGGGGKLSSWNGPPASFLGYLVSHEAHHRGLAIVSMRASGHRVPKEVSYGIWSGWGKKREPSELRRKA